MKPKVEMSKIEGKVEWSGGAGERRTADLNVREERRDKKTRILCRGQSDTSGGYVIQKEGGMGTVKCRISRKAISTYFATHAGQTNTKDRLVRNC